MLSLDVRHGLRALVRRPAFTAIAVITLALGIGADTAIFSATWHLLLSPLPFPDGDRMGYVWDSTEAGFQVVPTVAEIEAFEAAARTLDWIEPYSAETLAWRAEGAAETAEAGYITASLPARLGVSPVMGRSFSAAETAPAGPAVALVSESFWRTRLGRSSTVIGSALHLNDRTYEVIGVMPDRLSAFRRGFAARDVWLPLDRTSETRLNVLAAHREGVTPAETSAELAAISANVPESDLGGEQPRTVLRLPADMLGSSTRTALLVLLGAVGLVLLVACANVAGLLVIRGSERQGELAIRAALGASRGRIMRYLMTETVLIALAGGAAGLLVGAWGIDAVRSIRPTYLSELDGISLEPMVLAFAGGVTLLTVLLFGLLPSLHAARPDLRSGFAPAVGAPGGRHGNRAGRALVIGEIALAVVLLVGASLLVRTMAALQSEPLGFDGSDTVRFVFELPRSQYPDQESWAAFGDRLEERLEAIPGASSIALSTGVPPELGIVFGQLQPEGGEPTGDRLMFGADVGPAFFRTLGIEILEGRAFDDSPADAQTVIVNRRTADRLWPGESAIGRRIRVGTTDDSPFLTVVGVTPDIAVDGPGSSVVQPQLFLPIDFSFPLITAAVRVRSGDPLAIVPAVRAAVAGIDPGLPVRNIATIDRLLEQSVGRQRFNLMLFGSFAVLALVLAAIGLYGIVAFTVSRRTRELGVRAALGASPRGVRAMVVRQSTLLALAGAGIGAGIAWLLTPRMASMLHDVEPRDLLSFAAACILVIAVSLAASWIPARRASRVDPMVALREE